MKDRYFNQSLGKIGEKHVRHLFLEAGFPRVSRLGTLGKVLVNGILADLRVLVNLPNGEAIILFVEVKNCREVFYPRCGDGEHPDIFRTLLEKAIMANAQPVLVAAHISKEGKKYCRESGIAFLELGYQIVPNAWKTDLRRIPENVLGANEYLCGNPDRPFHHGVPEQAEEVLRKMGDLSWIAEPHKVRKEQHQGKSVR